MEQSLARLERRVRLEFRGDDKHADRALRSDLSAVSVHGRCLWVASDEVSTVERLLRQGDGSYAERESLDLAKLFGLPQEYRAEMDIEGLDVADGYLWVVGSHSRTRSKLKPHGQDPAKALERLKKIRHHPARHLLGRIPLAGSGSGVFEARARAEGKSGDLRHSGCLKITQDGDDLDRELRADDHIGPFLEVPAKENGFDIEGIAACGERVLLGLRGPVLRGWAVLLQLEVEDAGPGRLALSQVGPKDQRHIKHFLDLRGLGVRELARDGDSLLILAGPTMALDGPVVLYRWPGAFTAVGPQVVTADRLEHVLDLPYGRGRDHAEGICLLLAEGGAKELLVVYDSPANGRLHAGSAIDADVFSLGGCDLAGSGDRPAADLATRSPNAQP